MASTVWRGRIAFGMVSIPVRLQKAARHERIRFHEVYRTAPEEAAAPEAPPGDETPDEAEEEQPEIRKANTSAREAPGPIPKAHANYETPEQIARVHHTLPAGAAAQPILKGYEIEPDRYVVLEPKEIARLRPRTSTELPIIEFVLLAEIDPIYFDTSYYVLPDKGGEKPYAILFDALRKSGYVAIGTLAMHGREHGVVIRPANRGLVLHTLFHAAEVRSREEYAADTQPASSKELELATMLIRALEAKFDPARLKDTYEDRLRELIDRRAASGTATSAGQTEPAAPPAIDILEALRKSLAAARKPVQSESGGKKAGKTKRGRGGSN